MLPLTAAAGVDHRAARRVSFCCAIEHGDHVAAPVLAASVEREAHRLGRDPGGDDYRSPAYLDRDGAVTVEARKLYVDPLVSTRRSAAIAFTATSHVSLFVRVSCTAIRPSGPLLGVSPDPREHNKVVRGFRIARLV